MTLGTRPFNKGLIDLGNGGFAYLQPDGSWGFSNAGLIVDGEEALLVDTLFDLELTSDMLAAMRRATPLAEDIGTVVNTHSNGDHCNGNSLLPHAEIIASQATAEDMPAESPQIMSAYAAAAADMGEMGEFFLHCFGQFKFDGIEQRLPTQTYQQEMTLNVGDKKLQLIEVGPAHTRGDTLVFVPDDKLVFTGDILFIEGHPIMWEGPVGNWIDACDRILNMDIETVVPGHGPVTDKRGVTAVRDYLAYLALEARKRFDAGMEVYDAAMDIALTDYSGWGDAERIVVNVNTLYREFSGSSEEADVASMFGMMAQIRNERFS